MTDSRVNELVATSVTYQSSDDEAAFFACLRGIDCVGEPWGRLLDLHIPVMRAPTDAELAELEALFVRYGIETSQLGAFKGTTGRV